MVRAGPGTVVRRHRPEQRKADLREANLPTEHAQAGQATWLPAPDVDARRPGDPEGEAAQGASSADRLSRSVAAERTCVMGPVPGRIRGRGAFRALARPASRGRSGPLSVSLAPGGPSGSAPPVRLGYAVGRRHGGSVRRNRLRRRLQAAAREAVRGMLEPLVPGDYLVSAHPDAATLDQPALVTHLAGALAAASARVGATTSPGGVAKR